MTRVLIAVVVMVMLAGMAQGKSIIDLGTGNDLLKCDVLDALTPTDEQGVISVACLGWMDGFVAGHDIGLVAEHNRAGATGDCTDGTVSKMTHGQVLRIVVKYVKEHPEDGHRASGVVAYWALGPYMGYCTPWKGVPMKH